LEGGLIKFRKVIILLLAEGAELGANSLVWMPSDLQGKLRNSEQLIECGLVSGLSMRPT